MEEMDLNKLPKEEYNMPEDEITTSTSSGNDLPTNMLKYFLVVMISALTGIIIWGKDNYENQLADKDAEIKELRHKDCSEEIRHYLILIETIKGNYKSKKENLLNKLEESQETTNKLEDASTEFKQ
jgi:predicted house-cleaning noncanonical NTP pyrophosphatase (MazG superfamily)